jgi:hypothetical protein
MIIDELHILPTERTPEFFFNPNGNIKIRGRGVVVNLVEFPPQILNWINAYINNPAEITTVIIAFDYLNSYSTVNLLSTLRKLSKVIEQSKKLVIKWYYEELEDDIFDQGEYISATLNIPFEFIMTNNITDI